MPKKKKSKIAICLACYWRRFFKSPLGVVKPDQVAKPENPMLNCPECKTPFGVYQLFEVEV